MIAVVRENGPCRLGREGQAFTRNEYSWTAVANMLWVDQPANVGFSYAELGQPHQYHESEVAGNMYDFVQQWLQAYPQYQTQPFYIMGESYAGHFIPKFSQHIYEANKFLQFEHRGSGGAYGGGGGRPPADPTATPNIHVNLRGIGLGNGMTDPWTQFHYYTKMVWGNSYGVKSVSTEIYKDMMMDEPDCFAAIRRCKAERASCAEARRLCTSIFFTPYVESGKDIYDVRQPRCDVLPYCYDFENAVLFFNRPSVRVALGVRPESPDWSVCNFLVNANFDDDWMKSFEDSLPPLLEAGIKVPSSEVKVLHTRYWLGGRVAVVSKYRCKVVVVVAL